MIAGASPALAAMGINPEAMYSKSFTGDLALLKRVGENRGNNPIWHVFNKAGTRS